jgi:parvulin-like peptidyl-prolyl isomerase
MTIWNLTEFSEVQDEVVLSYVHPEHRGRRPRGPRAPRFVTVVACAAVMIASFVVSALRANSNVVAIPRAGTAVAQSLPEERPPLDSLFAGGFSSQWTREAENAMLAKIAQQVSPGLEHNDLVERTIDSIFSNQQDELSGGARLNRDTVARIVRNRKLV